MTTNADSSSFDKRRVRYAQSPHRDEAERKKSYRKKKKNPQTNECADEWSMRASERTNERNNWKQVNGTSMDNNRKQHLKRFWIMSTEKNRSKI